MISVLFDSGYIRQFPSIEDFWTWEMSFEMQDAYSIGSHVVVNSEGKWLQKGSGNMCLPLWSPEFEEVPNH